MEGEGEGSWLGGQWKEKDKVLGLVAIGMLHAWWPLECSMLGGHWNVKEKTPFHLFHFPPKTLLTPSIFPLDPTVLLYQGPKSSLTPFFPFLRSINYDCAPPCNKSFTSSLST
jgi:hypothetical protein